MFSYILLQLLYAIVLFILWYIIAANALRVITVFIAAVVTPAGIEKARSFESRLMGKSKNMIPISLLVPAYNEEKRIVESIKAMLNLNYVNFEIIVINDGSSDRTLEAVVNAFGLQKIIYPVREILATKKIRNIYYNPDISRLHLIDKERGGKCDALNAGVNFSGFPCVVSMDADSFPDPDALLHVVKAFMKDKYTIAAGGIVRVANGCTFRDGKMVKAGLPKKILPLFQVIGYLRSYVAGRIIWNGVNSLLSVSQPFGAFQKAALLAVGGFTVGAESGEMDLIVKLHRYMRSRKYVYRICFLPELVCWAHAPESFAGLFNECRRQQIGLMDVLGRNRDMFFGRKYGLPGSLALPYYFFFEMISPFMETLGIFIVPLAWFFGLLSLDALALFLASVLTFGIFASIGAIASEDFTRARNLKIPELLALGFISIFENIFYRPIVTVFRLVGALSYRKQKNPRDPAK